MILIVNSFKKLFLEVYWIHNIYQADAITDAINDTMSALAPPPPK